MAGSTFKEPTRSVPLDILSFRCPSDMLEQINEISERYHLRSRGEVIRQALRMAFAQEAQERASARRSAGNGKTKITLKPRKETNTRVST